MINRVVRSLILSDFVLFFAAGLLAPIFAIFILEDIQGSTLRVVGLATTFFWVARTLTTLPLSRLMDQTDGERDEFYFMIVGTFILASVPLFFLLAAKPWHIYLIQLISGLAHSMAVPSWRILFTSHLDRGRTGYEWSLEDIGVGAAIGISAYLGSWLADQFGFRLLFVLLAILGYLGTMVLIPIGRDAQNLKQLRRSGKLRRLKEKQALFSFDPKSSTKVR